MNNKLVVVTWSYDNDMNFIENSLIYKSFIKNNNPNNFYHIHFNRNNYIDLENEFNFRFGYQYEFLLYRIYLLRDKLFELNFDKIIFSDTNDVVCLGNINQVYFNSDIVFSSEKHKYPNPTDNWQPINEYSDHNKFNNIYLNGGLIYCDRISFISLLNNCVEKIFLLNYKNFGGDQGVFTYYLINNIKNPEIVLDERCEIFQNTYLTSLDWYDYSNNIFSNKKTLSTPIFVHDNGWNYGSPKIIENFKLL